MGYGELLEKFIKTHGMEDTMRALVAMGCGAMGVICFEYLYQPSMSNIDSLWPLMVSTMLSGSTCFVLWALMGSPMTIAQKDYADRLQKAIDSREEMRKLMRSKGWGVGEDRSPAYLFRLSKQDPAVDPKARQEDDPP